MTGDDRVRLGAARLTASARVELVVNRGARGYLGFGDEGERLVVETLDPRTHFSFRRNHARDEDRVTRNAVPVEFTVDRQGDAHGFALEMVVKTRPLDEPRQQPDGAAAVR